MTAYETFCEMLRRSEIPFEPSRYQMSSTDPIKVAVIIDQGDDGTIEFDFLEATGHLLDCCIGGGRQ